MSSKIDPALFGAHEHALDNQACPQCHEGTLTLKHGKRGPFLGCNRYPDCDYIHSLNHNDGHIVKPLGVACPKCENELVLRQGRYGMFIGCSAYPQCQHIESLDAPKEQVEATVSCPECAEGTLTARRSRNGKTFYACNAYPKCKFAVNFPPVVGQCQECGYPLLVEKKHSLACASRGCQTKQEN
ncbi:DNA topoisomerase family protein [Vibrio ulleungensis]|uniref:Topoisomerase DNA-binding C4 zinc finger domain-containing protein n=1 Tax=Vibrio ulleungensis TaxID=2807619 RepID=A0ABS2HQR6_9VIBR|nr:topoisomerase DNA-binding C4 zinc finger domain-containing protein [Vibrio ulleungensis]MBM7038558.1 topoisomerase DNA-binding C4 zinc finger domain-containing protein [Vibrio ulleungensis]